MCLSNPQGLITNQRIKTIMKHILSLLAVLVVVAGPLCAQTVMEPIDNHRMQLADSHSEMSSGEGKAK